MPQKPLNTSFLTNGTKRNTHRQFYTASADKTAAVWDVTTGERLKRFRGHDSFVNSVSAARRGDPLVLTGSDDCTAALWDVRQRAHVQLYQSKYQVFSTSFSDDASQVGVQNDHTPACTHTRVRIRRCSLI